MKRSSSPARDFISMTIVGIWLRQEPGEKSNTLSTPPDHFILSGFELMIWQNLFSIKG